MAGAATAKLSLPADGCLQVCGVDLASLKQVKAYCLKKKVCSLHLQVSLTGPHISPQRFGPACLTPSAAGCCCLQADVVHLPGRDEPYRFCHQCGKFERLDNFDGTKRWGGPLGPAYLRGSTKPTPAQRQDSPFPPSALPLQAVSMSIIRPSHN